MYWLIHDLSQKANTSGQRRSINEKIEEKKLQKKMTKRGY